VTILLAAALVDRQTGCMLMALSMGLTAFTMGRLFVVMRELNDWVARCLLALGLILFITQAGSLYTLATTVEVPAAEVPLPTPESPDDRQAPR
jgi:hypothetical protein